MSTDTHRAYPKGDRIQIYTSADWFEVLREYPKSVKVENCRDGEHSLITKAEVRDRDKEQKWQT